MRSRSTTNRPWSSGDSKLTQTEAVLPPANRSSALTVVSTPSLREASRVNVASTPSGSPSIQRAALTA